MLNSESGKIKHKFCSGKCIFLLNNNLKLGWVCDPASTKFLNLYNSGKAGSNNRDCCNTFLNTKGFIQNTKTKELRK